MPKPKFVKPLLIGLACAVPVGLIVGLSVNWEHTKFISAVGSSGVKPFIESFGKKYHQVNDGIDVTVESGGTTFAVEQLADGFTNIGNASNNPYFTIQEEGLQEKWTNKKTLTLGWEGLVLLYSLPKDLTPWAKSKFEIVINESNILQLYGVFSCIHELKEGGKSAWNPEWENLWFYAPDSVKQLITNVQDRNLLQSTKILPFVRSGGNTGANSSIAFSRYSNLKNFDDMSIDQQKAFNGGQYGFDGAHMETDESNSRAWQSFVAKDQPGSMVYLTTSFLKEDNLKLINDFGYKLAKYGANATSVLDNAGKLNLDVIDNQYNWFRPINIMVDINDDKTTSFVKWIYDCEEYKQTVNNNGAKQLSASELATMLVDSQLFSSATTDVQLAESREGIAKNVYGAIQDIWTR